MTIYRGVGGGGNATTDSEIALLTQLEQSATAKAAEAAASALVAEGHADDAADSATAANASKIAAASSASSASSSATAASNSASSASTSASNAASSASAASTSATNAASSATSASGSASSASTSASNAASSALAASNSATSAATSATNAASSASTATTQAGIATTQAGNAATSAINAANSATAASTSATNAASSATSASTSASNAAQSAIDAAAAAASIDTSNFVDRTTNQTIGGTKTFSNTIVGSINGNAATVTNGVTLADTQTLTNKTLTNPAINGFTGNTAAITIGTNQIIKDTSGNVGIGITPTQKLHVSGNILATGSVDCGTQFLGLSTDTATAPSFSFTGDTNTGVFSPGADQAAITTGGTARLTVTTAQFTGTLPWRGQNGTAAAPALSASGDTDTGIYFPSADTIGFSENGSQVGEFDSSGNFKFNSGYGSVTTAYGCRAWVNFNGTGTVAIRASGNVSSITDNGTGDYTVNFTTAMPDADYSYLGAGRRNSATQRPVNLSQDNTATYDSATTSFRFITFVEAAAAAEDPLTFNVAVFR